MLLPLVATRTTSISRLITAQEGKNSSRRTMASIRTSNLSKQRGVKSDESHSVGCDKTEKRGHGLLLQDWLRFFTVKCSG